MKRRPRPRDKGIVDIWIIVMSLLTGGFMAACLLGLIQFGTVHENSAVVGATLAITAFALFRIVCTYESRSMRDSVFHASTFDCKQINLISLGEIVLAFLVTEFDVLQRGAGHHGSERRAVAAGHCARRSRCSCSGRPGSASCGSGRGMRSAPPSSSRHRAATPCPLPAELGTESGGSDERPRQPPLSARSLMPRNIFWLITKLTVAMGSTINGAQRLL